MIVSVFQSEEEVESNLELLQNSDLALIKTKRHTWKSDALYVVYKSRFAQEGLLVPESELQSFVQEQEEKLKEVK